MRISRFLLIILPLALSIQLKADPVDFRAITRLNYYTSESAGHVMVQIPEMYRQEQVTVDLVYRYTPLIRGYPLQKGTKADLVPFSLKEFMDGTDTIVCSFYLNGKWISAAYVFITRLPARSNEVKIDHFSGGLVVDGLPFFPFGFYCRMPLHPALPEEEAVRGFNMISPYQKIERKTLSDRKAYMDRCAALGMKVHYQLLSVAGGNGTGSTSAMTPEEKIQLLQKEVFMFKDHPALLAWYIADEPDGQGVEASELEPTYRTIRELDPYHPVSMVFMTPEQVNDYRDVIDIAMADPYPVPDHPVSVVSEWTRRLHEQFYPDKPVWIVPQAFGGGEWWQREPTPGEVRVMTYLAVLEGASGIQYFIRHGLNRFPKSQAMWAECGAMSLEIADITPFLFFSQEHAEVTCSDSMIEIRSWKNKGEILVIAVNTGHDPARFEAGIGSIDYTGLADVLYENRQVDVHQGIISDIIDGMGTRMYVVKMEPLVDKIAGIDPRNLTCDPGFENNLEAGVPAACYAGCEGDRGATYFTDSRTSYQGYRSLRCVTPQENRGVRVSMFPVKVQPGEKYTVSVWAKTRHLVGGKKKNKDNIPRFRLSFGERSQVFEMKTTWQKYSLQVRGEGNIPPVGINPVIELLSSGTAWFDLIEVVPEPDQKDE